MQRYDFKDLARFSRLLGMIIGITLATALIPVWLAYVAHDRLTHSDQITLTIACVATLGLAVLFRILFRFEDAGVYVADGALIVRMGKLLDQAIPIEMISAVEPSALPWWQGIGVGTNFMGRLMVYTSKKGVVALHLKTPVRMHVLGVFRPRISEVRLSLDRPETFLDDMSAKIRRAE